MTTALSDSCKKYFGTRNIYNIMRIPKDSQLPAIKKAFYRMSLLVHPDRVPSHEKDIANEKFKLLLKLYQVLNDKNKTTLYELNKIAARYKEDVIIKPKETHKVQPPSKIVHPGKVTLSKLLGSYHRPIFKKETYVNSERERSDLKKAYKLYEGDTENIFREIPFLRIEDQPRALKIIQEMIDAHQLPKYAKFEHETARRLEMQRKNAETKTKITINRYSQRKLQDVPSRRNTPMPGKLLQQVVGENAFFKKFENRNKASLNKQKAAAGDVLKTKCANDRKDNKPDAAGQRNRGE